MKLVKIHILLLFLLGFYQVNAQRPCCWTPDSMPAISTLRDTMNNRMSRFEKEILAYERQDDTLPYPKDAILFVGSSSIRIWKSLAADMHPIPAVNRGFGGATMIELSYYSERIIYKYNPKAIVIYCGENDLAVDFSRVEDVLEEFKTLNEKRKIFLPDAKVFFISIKPSPSRAFYLDKFKMANSLIQQYINESPNELFYIDITGCMNDANGMLDASIFKKDRLHMNSGGYERWTKIIKPVLIKELHLKVK